MVPLELYKLAFLGDDLINYIRTEYRNEFKYINHIINLIDNKYKVDNFKF